MEDTARVQIKEFENWWTRVWDSGFLGKTGIILVLAAFMLPFLFAVLAALLAWLLIWPAAANVTERLAVLGFIFVVLTAIGVQLRNAANQIATVFFVTRRRRKRKPKSPTSGT